MNQLKDQSAEHISFFMAYVFDYVYFTDRADRGADEWDCPSPALLLALTCGQ